MNKSSLKFFKNAMEKKKKVDLGWGFKVEEAELCTEKINSIDKRKVKILALLLLQ